MPIAAVIRFAETLRWQTRAGSVGFAQGVKPATNSGPPVQRKVAVVLRLDVNFFDYTILAIYFLLVVAIGVFARRAVATSEDFLLSGRSLPAWVTGLAFISANLGAIEILGMAANGAQYGMSTLHFYWVGAVPAMVFLGLVMMPFYYGSRVRTVPEFLLRRFNPATHQFNAITFAAAAVLTAGVNLYALALVINALIGWPIWISIVVSALFVLVYITLGGCPARSTTRCCSSS